MFHHPVEAGVHVFEVGSGEFSREGVGAGQEAYEEKPEFSHRGCPRPGTACHAPTLSVWNLQAESRSHFFY